MITLQFFTEIKSTQTLHKFEIRKDSANKNIFNLN